MKSNRPVWKKSIYDLMAIAVDTRSTARDVFRIPLEAWMDTCVFSVFVLSCVGSGFAAG
jgi:hypothetical protein